MAAARPSIAGSWRFLASPPQPGTNFFPALSRSGHSMSAHQAPPSGLRRESPNTSYGGGGVGVEAGRRSPGQGLPAHAAGRGGVGAPGSTEQRFKVQTALVQEPAAAAVAPASTRVPEGAAPYAAIPTHTAGQPVVGRPIGGGDAQVGGAVATSRPGAKTVGSAHLLGSQIVSTSARLPSSMSSPTARALLGRRER